MEGIEGLKEIFTGEAEEILQSLEPDIVRLEDGRDPEVINRIFRGVHTLKGSSGMAGFNEISQFTHKLENLIDKVRSGNLAVDESLVDILLNSMDWIRMIIFGSDEDAALSDRSGLKDNLLGRIEGYRQGKINYSMSKSANTDIGWEVTDKRSVLLKNDATATAHVKVIQEQLEENKSVYKFFRIKAEFDDSIFGKGIDPLLLIEEVASLGRILSRKVERSRIPGLKKFDPEKCYLGWDVTIKTKHGRDEIEDIFLFVKDDNKIIIEDVTKVYIVPDAVSPYKIGEIMLSENIITENELSNVLEAQKTEGKKTAEIILEKGYASQDDVNYALQEQDRIRKKIESSTVRVATGKLDTLLNLLGEIIIGQSAISKVAELVDGDTGERLKSVLYGIDRTTHEFQEHLMAIRMVPIAYSFEQFKRFVRDTAKEYGKDIQLKLEGVETELDKTVIEKINDPLKHMIRNSIDHGIEMPGERTKCGKSGAGVIQLKAYHQEGNVYIEIYDDGKGIDRTKVRQKAEKLGLVKPGDELNDEKLLNFLFMPGFSTADKVGDLSGRGVGMDVVKTNIEQLKGSIKINSEIGKGTTFIIKLPLTLAIIDGMLVRIGKWTYIIPLLSIVESIQPKKDEVKTVKGRGEMIYVRDRYVTLLRTYKIFGIKPEYKNPWEGLVVIVESNGTYIGLQVDELLGQQQIVIKSLDSSVTKSRAIAGASILGDGTVSLIMDVHGLVGEMAA